MTTKDRYAIWWLCQADYDTAEANGKDLLDPKAKLPPEIRRELDSRDGRPGRCRLWVPGDILVSELTRGPNNIPPC